MELMEAQVLTYQLRELQLIMQEVEQVELVLLLDVQLHLEELVVGEMQGLTQVQQTPVVVVVVVLGRTMRILPLKVVVMEVLEL